MSNSGCSPICRSIEGVGLGLRTPHIETVLSQLPQVPWFELLTDNWLDASGIDGHLLDEVLKHYSVSLHGVSMNVGGTMPLNTDYLNRVKRLAKRCNTQCVSDHLAFTAVNGKQLHDLAPLPYTEEALTHVINRVDQVQNLLGFSIAIENISAYVKYDHDVMGEAEFLNQLAQGTGCSILLDVNNLYVNQVNLEQDAKAFLTQLYARHVSEMHLGGYTDQGSFLLDAHNNPVSNPVWKLYEVALEKFPQVPTLIEWDNDLPDFEVLLSEQKKAQVLFNTSTEQTGWVRAVNYGQ